MVDEIYKYEPLWGNWKIGELLGKGSIGSVYKISKKELGKEYFSAVKFIIISPERYNLSNLNLQTDTADDYLGEIANDITNEIDLLYKLKGHTNVISYEDHMVKKPDTSGNYYIFIRMEYAEPLLNYIKSNKISEDEVIKIGLDMCEALITCHKHEILHRDIKEANIFRSDLGNYKLGDFSISKNIENTFAYTRIGTLYYISPEVIKGLPYNKGVDIYSLGMVLYKLLNGGRFPFMPQPPEKFSQIDIEKAHLKRTSGEKFNRPLNGNDNLVKIVLKACEFNVENRYSSIEEMKRDLLRVNESFEIIGEYKKTNMANSPEMEVSRMYTGGNSQNENLTKIEDNKGKPKKHEKLKKIMVIVLVAALACGVTTFVLKYDFLRATVKKVVIHTTDSNHEKPIPISVNDSKKEASENSPGSDTKTNSADSTHSPAMETSKVDATPSKKTTPIANKNLLLDPGAETRNLWSIDGTSKGVASFSSETFNSGSYCFKIEQKASGEHYTAFYQNVEIEKGKKYILSCFVKTKNITSTAPMGAYIHVSYFDAQNIKKYFRNAKLKNLGSWTLISCEFTIPESAVNSAISVAMGVEETAGIGYFDDISLVLTQ